MKKNFYMLQQEVPCRADHGQGFDAHGVGLSIITIDYGTEGRDKMDEIEQEYKTLLNNLYSWSDDKLKILLHEKPVNQTVVDGFDKKNIAMGLPQAMPEQWDMKNEALREADIKIIMGFNKLAEEQGSLDWELWLAGLIYGQYRFGRFIERFEKGMSNGISEMN